MKSGKRKLKREKLEERVKYYLNKQLIYNGGKNTKNKNINKNSKPSITKKDNSHNQKNNKNSKKYVSYENKNNVSSLSTRLHTTNDKNINSKTKTQTTSIKIKKEVGKYAEPRFKIKSFQKLAPKFQKGVDMSSNLSQNFSHQITNSEIEMLEIDEKLPQIKYEQLVMNRITNIINDSFPFHFLIEIEKCYQEISKDLKGNKNKNLDYKIKTAAFFYNKDINKFLIRELCLFLCILFLDEFEGIKESDILDIYYCISYCHLNFIYLLMILINKTNEEVFNKSNNKKNINKNSINDKDNENDSYFYFQQCKTLIELNSDKINQINFQQNFHNNNSIIKNMLYNLLTNLSYINEKISNNMMQIINLGKKLKFKDMINNHIRNNTLIKEKIEKIIRESISPESSSSLTDDEDSENLPQPDPPFFGPKKSDDKREYCLVLDLDETLVHYFEDENEAYVKVRMGAENFIRILSKYCEIAIFTASTKNYADIVIDGLDCKELIDYRLYRQHIKIRKRFE